MSWPMPLKTSLYSSTPLDLGGGFGDTHVDMNSSVLDSLGLLKAVVEPKNLDYLSDADKSFLVTLYFAGPEGLRKAVAMKEEKKNPEVLLRLDAYGLASWQRDQRGQFSFFCISELKGVDTAELLIQVARHQSHSKARRAAA
jgi:hypothetical protein